jgi:hypothetical protein
VRAKLIVGQDGEIAVPKQDAEALGLFRGGEVEYLAARGTAALVVPVHGGEAPRAWFAGSLESLSVAEVIQFVFSSLKTGVLLLSFGDRAGEHTAEQLRRRSVHFKDGQVVFASSADPEDRLGPVLVDAGLVKLSDLERCSQLVRGGRPLGQVLVDEGVLDAGQLYQAITVQVRKIFLDCFTAGMGEFAFIEGITDEQNQVKLPERTRDLILQGMKRVAEAELKKADVEPAGAAAEAPAPAPEVAAGVEAPLLTPAPGTLRPAERGLGAGGPFETYRRIFVRVHGALRTAEADATARLNSWFDRLPEKRRALFEGVRFADDGALDVAAVLANVNASGQYRGAAARARALEALEELLAFALFEAKNRLPKEQAEKLLREVGRMQVGKA